MDLKLFNALGRKKSLFTPLKRGVITFYTCGPTVYDFAHIGNLRTYIFEDLLKRVLLLAGNRVVHVMNITNVDDKTIRGAKRAHKNLEAFTRYYTKEFFADLKKLNILPASHYPRATENIAAMLKIIKTLLNKEFAYESKDGVYFDISRFKNYGKLSGVRKRAHHTKARINADEYAKTEAQDFVLWKKKRLGEPSWSSPFGKGRPGWHIECSAMATRYLKLPLDIHAGGIDLLFPHHENEIAQSEAASGKKFARFFLEGEHLTIGGKKMSKSLGNLFTLRDLVARGFDPLDLRYLALTTHYRKPLSFSWDALESARQGRMRFLEIFKTLPKKAPSADIALKQKILKAVHNDLNIPQALGILRGALKHVSQDTVLWADHIFGLNIQKEITQQIPQDIMDLVEKRELLRKDKQWARADRMREKIKKMGFWVADLQDGPAIHRI